MLMFEQRCGLLPAPFTHRALYEFSPENGKKNP